MSRDTGRADVYAAEEIRRTEIKAHEIDESTPGTELVLRTKELEIQDFYKANTNARGSWRGGRRSGVSSDHASRAGREAGSQARLGGEKALGGARRVLA